eukprot:355541-Chlamydomonas_euryale.AAC.3
MVGAQQQAPLDGGRPTAGTAGWGAPNSRHRWMGGTQQQEPLDGGRTNAARKRDPKAAEQRSGSARVRQGLGSATVRPHLSVFSVSAALSSPALTHAIMVVTLLPPRESCRKESCLPLRVPNPASKGVVLAT